MLPWIMEKCMVLITWCNEIWTSGQMELMEMLEIDEDFINQMATVT